MIFSFFIYIKNTLQRNLLNLSKNHLIFVISIIFFLFTSCEKIPDGVVEQNTLSIKIKRLSAPDNFNYAAADSSLLTTIEFEDSKNINKVWLQIKSADGSTIITSSTQMFDNGNISANGDQKRNDNIYSAKVGISKKYSSGKYYIDYYIEDNVKPAPENITKVASHSFVYVNNQVNLSPVISNLKIPAAVSRGETFIFTLKVEDGNGLIDIAQVYFKLFRPDGSLVDPQNGLGYFLMVDDGNFNVFGDEKANDGIYSFKNSFGESSQTGQWKFEFQAKDKSGVLSNTIIYLMTVN